MTGIKAGDEVRVYDVNSAPARRGQHDPGEPGKVVKVGRTLVHIEYFHRTETFRIEDGRRNDNYGHQWFLTLEQAEVILMHDRIENFLAAHRLSRRARAIIRQNLTIALGVVIIMVIATAWGAVPLSIGVAAHEGSTLVVCINSLRLLFGKNA